MSIKITFSIVTFNNFRGMDNHSEYVFTYLFTDEEDMFHGFRFTVPEKEYVLKSSRQTLTASTEKYVKKIIFFSKLEFDLLATRMIGNLTGCNNNK